MKVFVSALGYLIFTCIREARITVANYFLYSLFDKKRLPEIDSVSELRNEIYCPQSLLWQSLRVPIV